MKDIHECIGNIGLAKSTIFTTFDLTSGFWKMPLHASSVPKTAFTLPGLGQYKWLISPTGLISCPASFQWLMEKLMDQIKISLFTSMIYSSIPKPMSNIFNH